MKKLAFVDTETTGLDPRRHEVISLALVILDPETLLQEVRRVWHMLPRWLEEAEPEALKANRFTLESWEARGPVTHREAFEEFVALSSGCIFIAHNVSFDRAFVEAELTRQDLSWKGDYHFIDTASMFFTKYRRGEIQKLSLSHLCDHYGVNNKGAHDALVDVDRMIEVFRELVREERLSHDH